MVSPDKIGGSGDGGSDFFDRWKMLMKPSEEDIDAVSEEGEAGSIEESEDDSDMKIWGEESREDFEEDDSDMKIYTSGDKISVKMPEIEEGIGSSFTDNWLKIREKNRLDREKGLEKKPSEATKIVSKELEEQRELVSGVGAFALSRAEVRGVEGKESEDAFFMDREDGMFGMFDGVGGGPRGGEAAKIAQQTLEEMSQKYLVDDFNDLVNIAGWMHKNVWDQRAGTTTAVLAKIRENKEGEKELHFASLGDSRLYLLRDGEMSQLTTDENVTEEDLDNAGIFDEESRDAYLKHGIKNGVGNQEQFRIDEKNFGMRKLQSGDRIVLCTDGVTGDVEEERMSPETMKGLLDANQGDDQMAAKMLVLSAKKRDDRTAIVISV